MELTRCFQNLLFKFLSSSSYFLQSFDHIVVALLLILLLIATNVHLDRIGRLNEGQYTRPNVPCVV